MTRTRSRIFILLVVIVIASIALVIVNRISTNKPVNKERFDNTSSATPLLVYKTVQAKKKLTIDIDPAMPATCIVQPLANIDWLTITRDGSNTSDLFASDTFTYSKLAATTQPAIVVLLNCTRSFYLTKTDKTSVQLAADISNKPNNLKAVIQAKLPIYTPSQTQRALLYAVTTSLGVDPKEIIFAQTEKASYITTRFDYLVSPNARTTKKAAQEVIDIGIPDPHILKTQLPFAQTEGVDMSIYFDIGDDKFPIKNSLRFKSIIWTRHNDIEEDAWIKQLIDHVGDIDDTNYYTMHFKFITATMQMLKQANNRIVKQGRLSVLEQFDASAQVVITPETNVRGYYQAADKTLVLEKPFIEGVPLEVASQVVLTKQDREEENGVYVYKAPWLVKVEEATAKPQEFICVGDPSIKNQGLCESPFDAMGELKTGPPTVWDRPCVQNTECPFYQKNTNYPNYRGGCNNGYCEMPLGVKQLGFRKYDAATAKPICHGCPPWTPYCCDLQSSPNYAFEMDKL
jgi:hypothetical protein